ncbi:MAG: MGMT family protein [Patescibacteria group bacterium]
MNTDFSKNIFKVVARIPPGRVLTYAQVASRAGRPLAYRAVGNILSQNHDPQIPCHRVIRSDGLAGGYNRGKRKKLELLKKEGVIKNKLPSLGGAC